MSTSSSVPLAAFRLSRTVKATPSPPIPQAYKWAASYVARAGKPLLDMSQGVPGIPPPSFLLNAMGKSASDPKSCGYCPATGEPSIKAALAKEMKLVYGQDSDIVAEDIAITAGCNMAFMAAIMAVASSGDEVILPVPWYFNHDMTLRMLGVTPVALQTSPENGFLPSLDQCAELVTEHTKAIVLVTPNNPTGAVYPPALIESYALFSKKHNIALIIDETYRDFIIDQAPHHLFSSRDTRSPSNLPNDWDWRKHFIHLFSFSKSYCIPGHRLGAIASSQDVLEQIKTILDCMQICPPRHVQLGLAPHLSSLRPFVKETALAISNRHKLFKETLPKTWHIESQGAYYAFVRHPFTGFSSLEVSRRMAIHHGIVTLPSEFFSPTESDNEKAARACNWIRFSVANIDDERVKQVCARLREIERDEYWATIPKSKQNDIA